MKDPCLGCENLEKRELFLGQSSSSLAKESNPQYRMVLKQSFAEPLEENLKYKHLFETAPDAIFIADTESGLILDANESAAKLLGIPVEEIIGMHQSRLHPPEEAERYKEMFQDHIENGTAVFPDDIYVCRKDGHKIPVQINATVTQIGSKKIIYGIFRDITKLKQLLKDLKASEIRFKCLSEAAFEAIAIHQDEKITDVNQRYLDLFGYTLEEVKAIPGFQMIVPQSRELVEEKMAAKYEGIYEAFGMKKDGTVFPVEVQARNTVLNGKSTRIAAFRDLTEQKILQQQLKDSEQRYRDLYDNSHVALLRTALDGTLLDCNRACLALFGYDINDDKEKYLNKVCVTDHYVDPARRQAFIDTLIKDKRVQRFEAELKRSDGTPFWVFLCAEMFPDAGYIEKVMSDITTTKYLTKTEKKVLDQLMQGKSNKEIARELRRSVRTIEDHRSHIMQKLGVDNLVDLTRKTLENNIIPDAQ